MPSPYSIVYLNGQFVQETQAVLSIFDRGFLYGDGLFETIRVCRGRLFRWPEHCQRLSEGADFLNLKLGVSREELTNAAGELLNRNQATEALLRVAISRGIGGRGYSPRGADHATVVMTLHEAAPLDEQSLTRWTFHVSQRVHLTINHPLAAYKTSNKLLQILAKAEAEDAGADEAILLNNEGYAVEAASGNLFWVDGNTICSPPLADSGILPGVTRQAVLEICRDQAWMPRETFIKPEQLKSVDGAFITLSSLGIVEMASVNGHALAASPRTRTLQQLLVRAMTTG